MFKHRSNKKELLDGNEMSNVDLFQNLRELHFINKHLGGYKISLKALQRFIKPNQSYILVDIGSGGGDTLKQIYRWSESRKLNLRLIGIDLKSVCIEYSSKNKPNSCIEFVEDDYRNITNHVNKVDIIHACLFCHHLDNKEIVDLINFSIKNHAILIINDLERNPIAYYAIKILTFIFSKSYLVKHDAPLSVLRGFTTKEWMSILKQSNAQNFSIRKRWAFRHELIIYSNDGS